MRKEGGDTTLLSIHPPFTHNFTTCCKVSFTHKKKTKKQNADLDAGQCSSWIMWIMEVGYSVTIVSAAAASKRRSSTHGHAESLSVVAVQFVGALLQRRVDDQLVTPPVVTPLLRRAARGMTVHAVRQT